ncbi:MAG: hypothetical protein ACKO2V_12630, partial [Snowella sp.]
NNLLEIEENLEIDQYYITHAEYQLFVDEWLTGEEHFPAGSAKMPVTKISRHQALGFCAWLASKAYLFTGKVDYFYYRLPTTIEAQTHQAREYQERGCHTMEERNSQPKGIRVVKTKIEISSLLVFDTITINAQGQEI